MVAGSNPVAPTILYATLPVVTVSMISYLSYRLGAALARTLPAGPARSLTEVIARAQYHTRPLSRRNVRFNLRMVMGEGTSRDDVDAAAKNVFSNFGKSIYFFLRARGGGAGGAPPDLCDYAGIDRVVRDLREKGGFIVAGPHVGPWEMGGVFLSALGLRIHTVALDHPSARVTRFFEERRRSVGIICHPKGGAFPVLQKALEDGSCVALLIDRLTGRGGKPCTFFGRRVTLHTGHAVLAARCRVPILAAVCVFASGDRFRFAFGGPHYPDPSLGEEACVEDLHQRCREDMERFIREHPDQWFNFKRFGETAIE